METSLIYCGRGDYGWTAEDFHYHCDNKGPTVKVIRSTKGVLAAGFTSVPWQSSGGDKSDPTAFVFTLS